MRDTEVERSRVQLTGKAEERSSTGSFGDGYSLCSAGLPSVTARCERVRRKQGVPAVQQTQESGAVRKAGWQ